MDRQKLEDLIRLVEDSDIHKLEISGPFTSVKITKSRGHAAPTHAPAIDVGHAEPAVSRAESAPVGETETTDRDSGLVPIVSPMVGTFYASASPESPPYVRQGDRVNKGQVICIVEAMKIMNEIESEVSGTMVRMLALDKQPVEYGQELFLVQPD